MEFNYYIIGLTTIDQKKLEISESRWERIKSAKDIVWHVIYIEQKYDLMISNYQSFEKELLNQSLDQAVRNLNQEWIELALISISRQIVNLISSIKLYVDHVKKRHVGKLPLDKQKQTELLQELEEYEKNSNDLNFITNLRNYVIHRDLPLDSYTITGGWKRLENEEERKLGHYIIPYVRKEKLISDRKFSTTVAENMPTEKGKIDLRIPIRKTIALLSKFNENFREKISKDFKEAKELIEKTIEEYQEFAETENDFCKLVRENKSETDETVFLDKRHFKKLELFRRRNTNQGTLEKRYIHNRI